MEETKVEPALTAEEWAHLLGGGPPLRRLGTIEVGFGSVRINGAFRSEHFHPLAAFFLYGQPFGFTWEDVDHLREPHFAGKCERCEIVYARIAALLPPRAREDA